MISRGKEYYDFIAQGLASMGYTDKMGNVQLGAWVNDMFAEKYNAEKTFAQMGFPLNPDVSINPTYAQLEATIRPYTMAAMVDIDSDGPSKSLDGLTLQTGQIPVWKHEIYLNRKIYREKLQLAALIGQSGGEIPSEISDVVMELFFNAMDKLIGGNYNTMRFLRNQVVSNQGKVVIDATNNPWGLPVEIDFGVPSKNITNSTWYKISASDAVVQDTKVTNGTVNPVSVARKIRTNAKLKDYAPANMHWECSFATKMDLLDMPFWRENYVIATRPDITDAANRTAYGNTLEEDVIWQYINKCLGPITVIDDLASVESIDTETHKPKVYDIDSFKRGVLVYVPDGDLGDAQFGKPVYIETPGARNALYDGGRTLIRTVFQDEQMNYKVKSEFQGLVVPNKTRWMYYLNIKGE